MKKFTVFYFIFLLSGFLSCTTCVIACPSGADSIYKESEVQLDSGLNAIFGTLTVPGNLNKMPVVLIIAGSGPTDRDGNNPFGLATNCYKMLSYQLAARGIATLRFDKRGVAKSTGGLSHEDNLSIGVYVNDAENWVKWLKRDQRFSKIIVLGHSEGALIGTLVSNFERVNGFISIAGAGVSADTLLIDQIYKQSPALADTARKIIDQIKKGESFYQNKELISLFRPGIANYLRSWFVLSPVVEISILRCPVLVVQGGRDAQISPQDAKKLADAKTGSKLSIIETMNHILKTAPVSLQENLLTYKDPSLPLAPELVPLLADFIVNIK